MQCDRPICCDGYPSVSMRINDDGDWAIRSLILFFHDLRGIPVRRPPSTVPCRLQRGFWQCIGMSADMAEPRYFTILDEWQFDILMSDKDIYLPVRSFVLCCRYNTDWTLIESRKEKNSSLAYFPHILCNQWVKFALWYLLEHRLIVFTITKKSFLSFGHGSSSFLLPLQLRLLRSSLLCKLDRRGKRFARANDEDLNTQCRQCLHESLEYTY